MCNCVPSRNNCFRYFCLICLSLCVDNSFAKNCNRLETLSRLILCYCHFIANLMYQRFFEENNWLRVVGDLVTIAGWVVMIMPRSSTTVFPSLIGALGPCHTVLETYWQTSGKHWWLGQNVYSLAGGKCFLEVVGRHKVKLVTVFTACNQF